MTDGRSVSPETEVIEEFSIPFFMFSHCVLELLHESPNSFEFTPSLLSCFMDATCLLLDWMRFLKHLCKCPFILCHKFQIPNFISA
jgi:hypothetical protein